MVLRWLTQGTLVLAGVATLAACHGTGADVSGPPPVSFDAVHALARVNPVAAVFDQPIFASFVGAESFFEKYFRATTDVPDNVKGKTFVYDVASASYVVDPSATAPLPSTVRYVLYAWDATALRPATPLTRIGYLDLYVVSAGTATTPQVVELVLIRDAPRLVPADLIITHATSNGVNVFGIEGSATDGLTSDDDIRVDGTESGGPGQHHLVYNTRLTSTSLGVSVTEQLITDQAAGTQGGTLELTYDGHQFADTSVATGVEIKVDGSLYARIVTTSGGAAEYLHADGTPLSANGVADLNALLFRMVAMGFFVTGLAWP
jgi:hypothetical protein